MSVILSKRNISKLEFFNTAIKLRNSITELLLRDFGIRDKIRKIKSDKQEYTIIEEYPAWLIIEMRQSIINILRNLIMNITAGNTIYPVNKIELYKRRDYQNEAIINCNQLLQEISHCADVFPLRINKLIPYVNMIEKELIYLKGWRKSNNKIAKKLGLKEVDFE